MLGAICTEVTSAHTEYVWRKLSEWDNREALDVGLMKKTIDRISVEKDGSIAITLINKAKLKGKG